MLLASFARATSEVGKQARVDDVQSSESSQGYKNQGLAISKETRARDSMDALPPPKPRNLFSRVAAAAMQNVENVTRALLEDCRQVVGAIGTAIRTLRTPRWSSREGGSEVPAAVHVQQHMSTGTPEMVVLATRAREPQKWVVLAT